MLTLGMGTGLFFFLVAFLLLEPRDCDSGSVAGGRQGGGGTEGASG